MNILYICHRFPFPPRRGGKIRPFNMIRHLTASGHQVTVASLARSAQEAEDGRGLAAHCAHLAYYVRVNHNYAMGREQRVDWPSSWRLRQIGVLRDRDDSASDRGAENAVP